MKTIERNVDFNNLWPEYVHDGKKREVVSTFTETV